MTDRQPYLALRDFKVWFSKRRGFVESLRRSEPGYVRAVDGIDITIGKGEIYCLVGESGCGKTTTGKGILQLVEPTGGDVFLNPTQEELTRYDAARATKEDETFAQDFRERKSLTYKEKIHRTPLDWAKHAILTVGGAALGALAGYGLLLALRGAGAAVAESVAYFIVGAALAFVATLPWAKMSRRVPYALALAAIPAAVVTQLFGFYSQLSAANQPADVGAVLGYWGGYMQENSLFVGVTQIIFAVFGAWYFTGVFHRIWDKRRGVVTDRLRKLRTRLQIIFQDPYESLNPRHTVYTIVAEPLVVNRVTRRLGETGDRVEKALTDAGLRPPKEYLLRYPHEMSGGQRQRVSIAGALVLDPEFLVADEPVSMLDVSIRTEIIELLLQLRAKRDLTYLFITHDLSLAWVLADRIGVMYLGKIVEEGPTTELIANPRHPYTRALISVVPIPNPDVHHERMILKGERPDPSDIPAGCRFHPRCPVAFERCGWTSDEVLSALRELATGEDARFLEGAALQGPNTIAWATRPDGLESWLRGLIAEKSEGTRALKAIEAIDMSGTAPKLTLHAFSEPTLQTVAPGVLVSCHLFPGIAHSPAVNASENLFPGATVTPG